MGIDVIPSVAARDPELQSALAIAWQSLSAFGVSARQQNDLFVCFSALNDVLFALNTADGTAAVEAAMVHVDYLADKAGCNPAVILDGGPFTADRQVILDALANISDVLRVAAEQRTRQPPVAIADMAADADPALVSALALAWQTLSGFGVPVPASAGLFTYFAALGDLLTAQKPSGCVEWVAAAMPHVDYLADKAACSASLILGGGAFTTDPQIILEALLNISAALQPASPKPPEQPPADIPEAVFAMILAAEAELAGWCSREKALVIARTVLRERPAVCVEIGIFGGRSLVPCAAALRHIGAGAIYGIEAWSPNVAIENATNEVNDEWWSNVDFAGVKREFYRFVAAKNLTQHVRLIESPSGRAAGLFDQIDFLHIDGSHSVVNAAEDVVLYARKVRSGGIIVFDDVNWQSTAPARALLAALCDTVTVLQDPESGLDICAVLRRR